MKFYHVTKEEAWEKIQKEGVLYGVHPSYRYTYLSPEVMDSSYGTVVLEVRYKPRGFPYDNYGFNPPEGMICWQFSVFKPIPIKYVKRLSPSELLAVDIDRLT